MAQRGNGHLAGGRDDRIGVAELAAETVLNGRRRAGFTAVELIVVVAIIGILMLVAFPAFLRSRNNANEASAVNALRTLSTAVEAYRIAQTPPSAPPDLEALTETDPPYIDSVLAAGQRQGYTFTYERLDANRYTVTAEPVTPGVTGTRTFFVDETGILRGADSGTADAESPPLE